MLISTPVIWNPDFRRPFVLQTDASDLGVGAVLSQYEDEGHDHLVAYFSRKILPREVNYSTVEKECLLGVQAFQVYLLGRPFSIQTDHRALHGWTESRTVTVVYLKGAVSRPRMYFWLVARGLYLRNYC